MPQANDIPSHPTPDSSPVIQAGELGQYSFCHRAWWLGTVKKIQSQNQAGLTRGRTVHTRHDHRVRAALRWRQAGFWLMGAGSLFFIALLFWLWLTGF